MARRRTSQEADAEDVSQEALLRAWRSRGSLQRRDRLAPWLSTIVKNEAVRAHERRRTIVMDPADIDDAIEDERLEAVVERNDLRMLLAHLDPLDRRMMMLRYGEDMTQPAIARALGIPEGTIKVRLHRARKQLRRMME